MAKSESSGMLVEYLPEKYTKSALRIVNIMVFYWFMFLKEI